jgi:hypothetical protein
MVFDGMKGCAMGQALHKSAATIEAVSPAIPDGQKSMTRSKA